jgi:hypothetical protein
MVATKMTDLRKGVELTYHKNSFPNHSDLYSNFIAKLFHAESPIDHAK